MSTFEYNDTHLSVCCAATPHEHYVDTEESHGREGTRFDHYTCSRCGARCSVVSLQEALRVLVARMTVQERSLIARDLYR